MNVQQAGDISVTLMPDDDDNPFVKMPPGGRPVPYVGIRRREGEEDQYVLVGVVADLYEGDGDQEDGMQGITLTRGYEGWVLGSICWVDPEHLDVFRGTVIINAGG